MPCRIREHALDRGYRAVTLENDLVSVTLLPEKGADIYALAYRNIDVLWKSPWGLKRPGSGISTTGENTEAAWLEHYEGGWQEIFPNGGDACMYDGVLLNFHGEASALEWDYTVRSSTGSTASVEFSVRLYRSPFVIRRTVIVEEGLAAVLIREKVTNEAEEDLHFMWGHHPAYGAPFLAGNCRVLAPARTFLAHHVDIAPAVSRVAPGVRSSWPVVAGKDGSPVDLSVIPCGRRATELGYLCDLDEGWYGLWNRELGFGVGLAWPRELFPYVWLWQELRGSFGFPWYGRCYVMALEPFTSIPGTGLVNAIERGTSPLLSAAAGVEAELAAVFFEGAEVKSIATDGTVKL